MPKNQATLALTGETDTTASFTAQFEGRKSDNRYSLWVALNGYDGEGVHRSASFAALIWDGSAGAVTVAKNADPEHPVNSYQAFVAEFPDVWDAVSNEVAF